MYSVVLKKYKIQTEKMKIRMMQVGLFRPPLKSAPAG